MSKLNNRHFTREQYNAIRTIHRCRKSGRNGSSDTGYINAAFNALNSLDSDGIRALSSILKSCASAPVATKRQERIQRLSGKFSGEVFYSFWSRDCDLAESANAYRFANELLAQEYIDSFYSDAEGPAHHEKITEGEYKSFHSYFFDRAAAQAGY